MNDRMSRDKVVQEKPGIHAALSMIRERIGAAARRAGRDAESVKILAVSKGQPIEKMVAYAEILWEEGSVPLFGENYIQEIRDKVAILPERVKYHMIGRLQRNKASQAIKYCDVIQSVDSLEVAAALNDASVRAGKIQSVYLQVNISSDQRKSGFAAREALEFLERDARPLSNLRFCGAMTITRLYNNPEEVRGDFVAFRGLKDLIVSRGLCPYLSQEQFVLSMGMSSDFDVAIEEGADIVRIGTLLFGQRIS